MQNFKSQQGKSMIAVCLFFIMAGFIVVVFMKVLPAYLEYMNVRSSVESLTTEPTLKAASSSQRMILARRMLRNRFMVNDVKSINMKRDVKFTNEDGGLQVAIHYKRMEHVMANVDAVMTFDKEVLISYKD